MDLTGEELAHWQRLQDRQLAASGCPQAPTKETTSMRFYFFKRNHTDETEAKTIVSRTSVLPDTFDADEIAWPDLSLCFIVEHSFSEKERVEAYLAFKRYSTRDTEKFVMTLSDEEFEKLSDRSQHLTHTLVFQFGNIEIIIQREGE